MHAGEIEEFRPPRLPKVRTSVTSGRPMVRVPVLSNAMTFTVSMASR